MATLPHVRQSFPNLTFYVPCLVFVAHCTRSLGHACPGSPHEIKCVVCEVWIYVYMVHRKHPMGSFAAQAGSLFLHMLYFVQDSRVSHASSAQPSKQYSQYSQHSQCTALNRHYSGTDTSLGNRKYGDMSKHSVGCSTQTSSLDHEIMITTGVEYCYNSINAATNVLRFITRAHRRERRKAHRARRS